MESIGDKLREAREELKLSVKEVARETHISSGYIEALESEDFDKFPAEAYLIGFLKSYSSFLKLNPDEIVQSYKGYKIGESVTPLEELTRPTKVSLEAVFSSFFSKYKNVVFITLVILVIATLSFAAYKVFEGNIDVSGSDNLENIRIETNKKVKDEIEVTSFQLNNDKGVGVIKKNDVVQFLVGSREVVFHLKDVNQNSITIEMQPEKKLEVLSFNKKRKVESTLSSREMFFTLKAVTGDSAKIFIELGDKKVESSDGEKKITQKATTEVTARNEKNLKIIFDAEFSQKCFVELYLDGEHKPMRMFRQGEKVRWEATEFIQIRVGSAGAMKIKINDKNYTFGKNGEVKNKLIKWEKDPMNPNKYKIVVKDSK